MPLWPELKETPCNECEWEEVAKEIDGAILGTLKGFFKVTKDLDPEDLDLDRFERAVHIWSVYEAHNQRLMAGYYLALPSCMMAPVEAE